MTTPTCGGTRQITYYAEPERASFGYVYAERQDVCPGCEDCVCRCGEPATHDCDGTHLCDDCYTTGPHCRRCDGTGERYEQPCCACHGRGELESPAEREQREAMECAEEDEAAHAA